MTGFRLEALPPGRPTNALLILQAKVYQDELATGIKLIPALARSGYFHRLWPARMESKPLRWGQLPPALGPTARYPLAPAFVLSHLNIFCHPERTGPQAFAGVPKERFLLFGVELGGGESKDLRLIFNKRSEPEHLRPGLSCFSDKKRRVPQVPRFWAPGIPRTSAPRAFVSL